MGRVKLHITGLSYSHSQTEAYALILAEEGNSSKRLPIIIGKNEAQAIAIYLEQKEYPRPRTHDLIKIITETLQGDIAEVCIVKLLSGVFHADIALIKDSLSFKIDARASDAIALALRFGVPIYCKEEIMEAASFVMEEEAATEEKPESTAKQTNSFEEYSAKQLKMMMNEAVRDENYERAASLKQELEKRNKPID